MQKQPFKNKGFATVIYNDKKILDGKYKSDSEYEEGSDKDTIQVELENNMMPIEAVYVHQYEYNTVKDFKIPTLVRTLFL